MLNWWEKNFAECQLGDERLNNRAYSIGKTLTQGCGKGLSEIFKDANSLKRADEFLPTLKQNWKRKYFTAIMQILLLLLVQRE